MQEERTMTKIYNKISKKQAGVIYRAYKSGQLNISSDEIKEVYGIADLNSALGSQRQANINDRVLVAIEKIFEGDFDGENGANYQMKVAFGRM